MENLKSAKSIHERPVGILELTKDYSQDWDKIQSILEQCSEAIDHIYIRKVALWMAFHHLIDLKQLSELRAKCTQKKEPDS